MPTRLLEMAREKLAAIAKRALVRGAPARVVCGECQGEVPIALADPYAAPEGADAWICAECSGRLSFVDESEETAGRCLAPYHDALPLGASWDALDVIGYLDTHGEPVDASARDRIAYEIRKCNRCGHAIASAAIF